MTSTIKLKRSNVAGKVPSVGDIVLGELAVNTFDGRVFFKKNDGADAILELARADNVEAALAALAAVASTGDYADLINTPPPFSGSYNDLTDTPVIPGASLTLIDEQQLTANVSAFTYTGLSIYRAIRVVAAIWMSNTGASTLQARVAGGTWRTIYTSGAVSDSNNKTSPLACEVHNFNVADYKVMLAAGASGQLTFAGGTSLQMGASTSVGLATFAEVWDELRLTTTAAQLRTNSHFAIIGER